MNSKLLMTFSSLGSRRFCYIPARSGIVHAGGGGDKLRVYFGADAGCVLLRFRHDELDGKRQRHWRHLCPPSIAGKLQPLLYRHVAAGELFLPEFQSACYGSDDRLYLLFSLFLLVGVSSHRA